MSHETERRTISTPSVAETRGAVHPDQRSVLDRLGRRGQVAVAGLALGAILGGGFGVMKAIGGDNENSTPNPEPTAEAPVTPGVDTDQGSETEPVTGSLEFRESDLTPDILASLSDAEIISRMQISVADHPTVEDWAEQYVLRDNDVMRSGTSPSEINMVYDQGEDTLFATLDHYVDLHTQALKVDPESQEFRSSDILRLAAVNAAQANKNGEKYVIREDLESVEVTEGSAEEGAFSVNLTLRRQDNMADLEVTKNEIYQNTGNKLRTLSADVDILMKVDVVNENGFWKTAHDEVISSTPHEE